MSGPVFVIFPGAFHLKESFDKLKNCLKQRKYGVYVETLRSVDNYTMSVEDDAKHMKEILEKLMAENKQVILVLHSYAGIPGSVAIKGLRTQKTVHEGYSTSGAQGAIVGVVFLCAFVGQEGLSLKEMIGGEWAWWQRPNDESHLIEIDDVNAKGVFSMAQPFDLGYYANLKGHSIKAFEAEAPAIGYRDAEFHCRKFYIKCTEDKAIPPQLQDRMMQALGDDSIKLWLTSGHIPFITHAEQLADKLCEALFVAETT